MPTLIVALFRIAEHWKHPDVPHLVNRYTVGVQSHDGLLLNNTEGPESKYFMLCGLPNVYICPETLYYHTLHSEPTE